MIQGPLNASGKKITTTDKNKKSFDFKIFAAIGPREITYLNFRRYSRYNKEQMRETVSISVDSGAWNQSILSISGFVSELPQS
jgi:hypothetical protein